MRYLLIALLAFTLAPAAEKEPSPGSEKSRWPIKTSVPTGIDPSKPGKLIKLDDFLAMKPAASSLTKEYWDKLFPKIEGAPAADGDIVRTQGYMRLVAQEDDGDFHIQITTKADTTDNCLVVEVPDADPKFITSPEVLAAAKDVRDFVIKNILHGQTPKLGSVHVLTGQAYVEVKGQLFFDGEHEGATEKGTYRGKQISKGVQLPSKTTWEIHPITSMKFAAKPQ